MNETKCQLTDKLARCDAHIKAARKRLRAIASDSYEAQELRALIDDLNRVKQSCEQKLPNALEIELTERQRASIAAFTEESSMSHDKAVRRFAEFGDYRQCRLWAMQALDVRKRAMHTLNIAR